jgi:putative ABC transport system permease protein
MGKRSNDELDEEMRLHIQNRADDLERSGLSRGEAERRARIEFGGMERFKEEVRETRWVTHWDSLFRDFRYAFRSLRKDRRFVGTAVFAMALGIAAATVAFSAFYNLLFNAFAARDAGRLVVLAVQNGEASGPPEFSLEPLGGSLADLDAIRAGTSVFEDIVGSTPGNELLKDGKENHQVHVAHVTGNAFEFYGVPPLMGRGIIAGDARPGAAPIVVMNYRTWVAEFAADPQVLGKSFLLNGEPRTLVGVMPQRFQAYGASQQLWVPIPDTPNAARSGDEPYIGMLMARLKPGVSIAAASAELDVVVKGLAKNKPGDFPKHFTARVQSATDFLMGPWGIGSAGGPETEHFDIKHMLYDLLAGVMLLVLIACSGVANLLLARGAAREKEIALRAALGATRGRLVRQLLVESAVLATGACAAGCVFAYFGLKLVAAAVPHKGQGVGGEAVIGLDPTVLCFLLAITALTTLLSGLAPAVRSVARDLQPMLAGSGKGTGGSFRHGRFRAGLVVTEVALSMVLLTGAGLMIRSFYELTHIDLGFNEKNLFFLAPGLSRGAGDVGKFQEDNWKKVGERLKSLPGVTEVAVNNSLPGYNAGRRYEAIVPRSAHSERAGFDGCSENLLRTLEMQMSSGRWLSEADVDDAQPVAVINQTMATHFFGGENPLGRQIQAKGFDEKVKPAGDKYFQVIGVVRDIKDFGPQVPVVSMAFIPYTIRGGGLFFLKTRGNPALLLNAVRQEVWAVDRDAIFSPQTGPYIDLFYGLTYSAHEFGLTTFTGVAGIALLLVVIGVFSVMAYTVSLGTQEIGVRMALGAQQGEILRMVLRKGFALLVVGISIGLLASLGLTRFLSSQIWGVSATDPWTFGAVAALVVGVGLAACYLPARRATEVDPLVALRSE